MQILAMKKKKEKEGKCDSLQHSYCNHSAFAVPELERNIANKAVTLISNPSSLVPVNHTQQPEGLALLVRA